MDLGEDIEEACEIVGHGTPTRLRRWLLNQQQQHHHHLQLLPRNTLQHRQQAKDDFQQRRRKALRDRRSTLQMARREYHSSTR